MPLYQALALWASLIISVLALSTCEQIASTTDVKIEAKLSLEYTYDQTQYWSSACGGLSPTCILAPGTANEVSTIVKALLQNNETFAIKSGGHNPNRQFSSVEGGPLISLKNLNEVTYLPASGTVRVGPGNRWTAVAQALEPYNVTVVGGRIGHVGVGGYLVGGGLSYLSSQYGWAVDSVVAFEVVLANGTMTTASATENVDLFNALRGGGNNFGIVTAYIMKAYPMGSIWGGNLVFSSDKTDEILAAVRNFTEFYPDDKAAIIATNEITLLNLVDIWILFLFYDGETPPPGTFDMFLNIGPLLNTGSTKKYSEFLSSEDAIVITGQVYELTTETSPLPSEEVGPEVMKSYHDHFYSVAMDNKNVPGLLAAMAIQPLPKRIAQKSKANGGDLLDLDDSMDRLILEYTYAYTPPATSVMDNAVKSTFTGARDRIQGFIADGKLPDGYLPLFMNDVNRQQDFFSRLRPEKLEYARGVRDTYDPSGFFRDRTGGFKLQA